MTRSRGLLLIVGWIVGLALVAAGLWAWQYGGEMAVWGGVRSSAGVADQMQARAVRCGAIGLIALAQVIWMGFSVGMVYRRDRVSNVLTLSALLVFLLSAAAAVALGLSGR